MAHFLLKDIGLEEPTLLHEISRKRLNDPPKENNFSEPLPLLQSSQPEGRYMAGPCALEVQWHTCFHDTPFQGSVVCLRQASASIWYQTFPCRCLRRTSRKQEASREPCPWLRRTSTIGSELITIIVNVNSFLNHYRKSKILRKKH